MDDIDPAVEQIILHCLEKEPHQRPSSARLVAAALPGGDPLAAALAAGETPTPELVAAAGGKVGLEPRLAVSLLAGVAVLVIQEANWLYVVRLPAFWNWVSHDADGQC